MVNPTRGAFPVIQRFIKANDGRLYPVTHSFIVKQGEGGDGDDSHGEMLESTISVLETEVLS